MMIPLLGLYSSSAIRLMLFKKLFEKKKKKKNGSDQTLLQKREKNDILFSAFIQSYFPMFYTISDGFVGPERLYLIGGAGHGSGNEICDLTNPIVDYYFRFL